MRRPAWSLPLWSLSCISAAHASGSTEVVDVQSAIFNPSFPTCSGEVKIVINGFFRLKRRVHILSDQRERWGREVPLRVAKAQGRSCVRPKNFTAACPAVSAQAPRRATCPEISRLARGPSLSVMCPRVVRPEDSRRQSRCGRANHRKDIKVVIRGICTADLLDILDPHRYGKTFRAAAKLSPPAFVNPLTRHVRQSAYELIGIIIRDHAEYFKQRTSWVASHVL